MNYKFTQADADELCTPLPLLHSWEKLMHYLWSDLKRHQVFAHNRYTIENIENSIVFTDIAGGEEFKAEISVNFVNHKYLQLHVKSLRNEDICAKINYVDKMTPSIVINFLQTTLDAFGQFDLKS